MNEDFLDLLQVLLEAGAPFLHETLERVHDERLATRYRSAPGVSWSGGDRANPPAPLQFQ